MSLLCMYMIGRNGKKGLCLFKRETAKMYFAMSNPDTNAFAGNPVNPPKFSNGFGIGKAADTWGCLQTPLFRRFFDGISVVFPGFILKKTLTLLGKSGKVNKSKRDDENQYAHPSFLQRAVVWCKTAEGPRRIPFRAALLKFAVGGDGCARYCANGLLGSERPQKQR